MKKIPLPAPGTTTRMIDDMILDREGTTSDHLGHDEIDESQHPRQTCRHDRGTCRLPTWTVENPWRNRIRTRQSLVFDQQT
jgi:hypothetical protein